jgi:hypothetical protein
MGALRTAGLIAVAGGERLLLIDPLSGTIRSDQSFSARINALDVEQSGTTVAVAAGTEIALVPIAGGEPTRIQVPGAGPGRLVGQVRFDRSGKRLFASAGTAVAQYDLQSQQFVTGAWADLSSPRLGFDQPQLDQLLGLGLLALVELVPDLVTEGRAFLRTELDLRAVDVKTGTTTAYAEDARGLSFLGVGFADQAVTGSLRETVAITGRRNENDLAFHLSYISEANGKAGAAGIREPFSDKQRSRG